MKLKRTLFLAILFVLNLGALAQKPEWLKNLESIRLLESTRLEIENTFGPPTNPSYKYHSVYKLGEGRLSIEYSQGRCNEAKVKGWDVPELTVTRLFFFPRVSIRLEDLKMDFNGFQKSGPRDVPGAYGYGNDELGIDIDVNRKGEIEAIEFFPSKKYDKLRCGTENTKLSLLKTPGTDTLKSSETLSPSLAHLGNGMSFVNH